MKKNLNLKYKNIKKLYKSIKNTHTVQTCVEFLPWRGGAEKCDMLRNLAHMFLTCFNQIQGKMISQ